MGVPFSLSDVRVVIWPAKGTGASREYTNLEIQYDPDLESLIIKQFPHLCSTQSYTCYELPRSSFSFISSESFMHSERIVSIRTHELVSAKLSVNTRVTGTTIEEEITTLNMACTLVDTSIPASSRLDMITTGTPKDSENVTLLIGAFGKPFLATEAPLDNCKNINCSDSISTSSISIGGEELDRMFSNTTRSSWSIHPDNIHTKQQDDGLHHKNAGSRAFNISAEQDRTSPKAIRPPSLQNPLIIEQDLRGIAESRAKFWDKKYGIDDAEPPIPASSPTKQVLTRQARSTHAWDGFALQHGGQRIRQSPARYFPAATRSFQNATPTTQERKDNTGGYCLDRNRDYTRADERSGLKTSPQQKGLSKRRAFGLRPHVQATFLPHMQKSSAQQQAFPFEVGVKHTEQRYW